MRQTAVKSDEDVDRSSVVFGVRRPERAPSRTGGCDEDGVWPYEVIPKASATGRPERVALARFMVSTV